MQTANPRVGLKEVAKAAGCSVAVASTVLNNAKGNTAVGAKTRERVLAVAQQLNYRPHFAARSLIGQRTMTLGLYIYPGPWAGIGYQHESQILLGIEDAARQQGYDLLLLNLVGDKRPEVCMQKLCEKRIDGLIILRAETGEEWLQQLSAINHNVVAINCFDPIPGLETFNFDNDGTVRAALTHLVQMGHRRIGFFGPCVANPVRSSVRRQETFIKIMTEMGLPVSSDWIHHRGNCPVEIHIEDRYCQLEGYWGIEHVLKLPVDNRPTAVLTWNAPVAMGAYQRMSERKLTIPGDLSIVSLGDSEECNYVQPPVTSIRHPLADMGREAVNRLIAKSRGTDEGTTDQLPIFAPALIIRESVHNLARVQGQS